MIYTKFNALLLALFFIPHVIWGAVHRVSHNMATVIELQEGDEISLVDFPVGWNYSRIVLGVNSIPGIQLSGFLVVNGCEYKLHDFYEEADFAYSDDVKIEYHGLTQRLPIHWWVDANPVVSLCKSYAEKLKKDSINVKYYNIVDSVFSERTKSYKDLGVVNSETYFEGTSSNFKITHLPKEFYNRICVQVVSQDGRELDGKVFVGEDMVNIEGYSSQFVLEQKTFLGPAFELVFTEYREVKLKWWVEVRTPAKKPVETVVKNLTGDSVEVEYVFGDDLDSNRSVKIIYNKQKFNDGKVPKIKKLSFNPYGNRKLENFGVQGDVYEIDASLDPDDSITVAIPIDETFLSEKNSVVMEYYDENENRWFEESIDSIVDNYAYLNKPQRSLRIVSGVGSGLGLAVACVTNGCSKVEDPLVSGLKKIFKFIKAIICLDVKEIAKLFKRTPQMEKIDQGKINSSSLKQYGSDVIDALENLVKNGKLEKLSDPYPECGENAANLEICKWQRTKNNLDILLADAVLAQVKSKNADPSKTLGKAKYKFKKDGSKAFLIDSDVKYNFDDYFMANSEFVDDAAKYVNAVKSCYGFLNPTGKFIESLYHVVDGVKKHSWTKTCNAVFRFPEKAFEWAFDKVNCLATFPVLMSDLLNAHSGKLQVISDVMVRISLLSWIKKADGFRDYALLQYVMAYNGLGAWLELAGSLMNHNNIIIKAYGGLALYEIIQFGTDDNLKMLNKALDFHYGENGGYSEGTGYSQYIWDDLTYVLAAISDIYKSQDKYIEISRNFMKSPDHMFKFSRPVGVVNADGKKVHYGLIPVEVDDGVTYNPDYRVWAKLKKDPEYLAMSDMYPLKKEDGKINPLVAFGFPDKTLYDSGNKKVPDRNRLWSDFEDGVGMITAVHDDDTVALSMIAENGDMWTRGQAHDQQDNLSITLTSSKKGFLIQDPGYSGFDARSVEDKFHRYTDHNVLTSDGGQGDNKKIPLNSLISRARDFTGDRPGIAMSIIFAGWEKYSGNTYEYSVEGGSASYVTEQKQFWNMTGFSAQTIFSSAELAGPVSLNNRSIMYFGGNFWVIDRPTNTDDFSWRWQVNSPMSGWSNLENAGVRLYGSRNGKLTPEGEKTEVAQNGSRTDFVLNDDGKLALPNYRYTAADAGAKSYVMTYSLGDEIFTIDRSYCPKKDYQCFVNSTHDMRVIVPPSKGDFNLCDAFPKGECCGNARSTGITVLQKIPYYEALKALFSHFGLFKKNTDLPEWMAYSLDGNLYIERENEEILLDFAGLGRLSYFYKFNNAVYDSGKCAESNVNPVEVVYVD